MRLLPSLFLVGGGRIGLSNWCDCNVYVIDGGAGLAMIDAGSGLGTSDVLANMRADGLDPSRLTRIILTHMHADHAGGAFSIAEATGAAILAPAMDRTWLEKGTDEEIGLSIARRAGIYPEDYRFNHCSVGITIENDDVVAVGGFALRAVHTPGHSRGSTCYLGEVDGRRCLFSGDALSADGHLHLNSPDIDLDAMRSSILALRELRPAALFPGHGLFVLRNAPAHIDLAWGKMKDLTFEEIAHGNPFLEPRLEGHQAPAGREDAHERDDK